MNFNPQRVIKIIIAGNGGIGKTSLMKAFCYEEYTEDEKCTVGAGIFSKKFDLNGKVEIMQIWDLGGQDRFQFFMEGLIYGAHGAILGFDIKRRNTFIDLKNWLTLLRKADPNLPIVLVATKLDLNYHPALNRELAEKFVQEKNLVGFVETSSKLNLDLEIPFRLLIKHRFSCDPAAVFFLNNKLESATKVSESGT